MLTDRLSGGSPAWLAVPVLLLAGLGVKGLVVHSPGAATTPQVHVTQPHVAPARSTGATTTTTSPSLDVPPNTQAQLDDQMVVGSATFGADFSEQTVASDYQAHYPEGAAVVTNGLTISGALPAMAVTVQVSTGANQTLILQRVIR